MTIREIVGSSSCIFPPSAGEPKKEKEEKKDKEGSPRLFTNKNVYCFVQHMSHDVWCHTREGAECDEVKCVLLLLFWGGFP